MEGTQDFVKINIPGYEGLYQACSSGRIWSVERNRPNSRYPHRTQRVRGRYLALSINTRGYPKVVVYKDGKQRTVKVHVLIALAFHGPRPTGLEVNHIDGDKLNNRPENLEYVTSSENMQHAIRLGLRVYNRNN